MSEIMNVMDWAKLYKLIEEYKPANADIGLAQDWFWTGASLIENGKLIKDHSGYISSSWASPVLKIDMEDGQLELSVSKTVTKESKGGHEIPRHILAKLKKLYPLKEAA